MLLPVLVVEQGPPAGALLQKLPGHQGGLPLLVPVEHHHLQGGQGGAGVPVGEAGHGLQHPLLQADVLAAEAPGVGKSPAEQLFQVLLGQGLEDEHPAPGQESGVHLEAGVLRGGPDEHDAPLLHVGEKGVLLGLVEPVDLIHEQDGPLPQAAAVLRLLHHLLDLFDAAGDGAEVDKLGAGPPGDDPGQGGLPHPGRAPEDHRAHPVALDEPAQHLALSQQMALPSELLQAPGAHPGGQGHLQLGLVLEKASLFHAAPSQRFLGSPGGTRWGTCLSAPGTPWKSTPGL